MEFSAYVAARRGRLVRTAVLLGCPQADAEDVVQNALLRCYRSWRRVSRADSPDAYVHRILVNVLKDARARRWKGELPTAELPESVAGDADWATGIAVRRALAELRPHSWTSCSAGACHSALGGVAEVATGSPDPYSPAWLQGSIDGRCDFFVRTHRPPGAQIWLEWPQDGIFVCGSSFFVRTDAHGRIAAVTYVAPAAR